MGYYLMFFAVSFSVTVAVSSGRVRGGWCAWSAWSTCTSTCHYSSGTRKRSRWCECPVPQNGGHQCSGSDGEVEECSSKVKCPVNGGWSAWSSWAECSSAKCSTSPGVRLRTRKCNSPRPKYGGTCDGSYVEGKSCINLDNCDTEGFYGKWSSWSPCTFTCGSCAVKIRERKCFHIIANLNTDVIGNPKFYCNESKKIQTEGCKLDDCPDGKEPCDQYETVESYEEEYGKFADLNKDYSWDEDYHNQLNQLTNKEFPYHGVEGNSDESENYNFGQPDRSDEEEIKGILNIMDTVDDADSFVSLLNEENKENDIALRKPGEKEYEEDKGSLSDFGLVNPSDAINYLEDPKQKEIFNAVDDSGAGDSETHGINRIKTTMNWCDVLNHVQGEDAPRISGCCDILNKGLTNDTDGARLLECFALHYKYVIGDADDMIADVMKEQSSTRQVRCRYKGEAKLMNTICCAMKGCTEWSDYRLQNQCKACRSQNLCQSCHVLPLSG